MRAHETGGLVLVDAPAVTIHDLSPRALAVLLAYAKHGPATAAPSSRRLRADHAPTLSRAQWARGTRELVSAGFLVPSPDGVRVAVPANLAGATQ